MKKLFLTLITVTCFTITTKAQDTLRASSAYHDHLDKVVTLCDVVYEVKIISDTVAYLYAGGYHNNAKFTIAVKGNKLQLDWANLKRKHLCVTGVLQLYKNTYQIIASEPKQITVAK
ncbi:hypothetical protein [Mucilaginibacter panaciglaebae]